MAGEGSTVARASRSRSVHLTLGALVVAIVTVVSPTDAAGAQSRLFASPVPAATASSTGSGTAVRAAPATGTVIATLKIPRFGADYAEPIGEGIGERQVLNSMIGHFPETAMPGEPGNFALAGHRVTYGKPFNLIGSLVIGDPILVETPEGVYLYRFRTSEYVEPSAIDVTYPVPRQTTSTNTEGVITFVACNPLFSTAERIIAYGVFESFTPVGQQPDLTG